MLPLDELPDWLRPLVDAARRVQPAGLEMFLPPEDGTGRASAVLIALGESPRGPAVLLIERAADMRKHAGQVAFPGGAVDPGDADSVAAALREANEEVGLDPATVIPVAELPAIFIPPSGFIVSPVLGWWHQPHPVTAVDAREVARAAFVPLSALTDPANRFRVRHPSGWLGPGFEVDGLFVWGFTAALLDRLLTLGGWTRPWDDTRERPLPGALSGGPSRR